MEFDFRLQAPFCMILSGSTQSGKSTLTSKIIERRLEIISPPIDDVLYLYTEYQPKLFGELKQRVPSIQFHQGLPEDVGDELNRHRLVICDDLMTEISKSSEAINLFIRGSHHRNISIIFLVQNFFFKNLRTLTMNSKYIVLMKNVRENGFASILGRQMNLGKCNKTLEFAWKDCMKKRYGYLVIDYDQKQNDKYRFRNSIFPEEMTVYVSDE